MGIHVTKKVSMVALEEVLRFARDIGIETKKGVLQQLYMPVGSLTSFPRP